MVGLWSGGRVSSARRDRWEDSEIAVTRKRVRGVNTGVFTRERIDIKAIHLQ
jgi:hypothetical protein